jgi:hypothetical protein
MKDPRTKDQVEGAIQPADVQQAHLPEFEVGKAVSIAKTVRMRKARLGKIDTEDSTVRITEGDQSRLGGAATGA